MERFFWLLFTTVMFAGMFFFVPVRKIREYFSFGLFFGFFLALSIMFVGETLFQLWDIKEPLIPIAGFSFFVAFDWIPPVIVFTHYIRYYSHSWYSLGFYIVIFALATTVVNLILKYYGYWVDLRWNPFLTFLLALTTHITMATYLLLRGYIPRPGKII